MLISLMRVMEQQIAADENRSRQTLVEHRDLSKTS
jgi:hypothetical protein